MGRSFGEAALGWWASRAQARADRARPDTRSVVARDPAAGVARHPLGTRLVAPPEPLTLLRAVRPGTLAVALRPGRPAELHQPGSLLVPVLLSRTPTQVQVLSTAPVHLDVTVTDLTSLDGYPVEPVRLRLRLQLDAGDPVALAALVTEHGPGLEPVLLGSVQREVVAAVRGAVSVNRRADLHRLGTQRVLEDRWLPTSFAGGALLCRDTSVLGTPPEDPDGEPTLTLPSLAGLAGSSVGSPAAASPDEAASGEAAPMAGP